jgi:excisionase family DNA binding protein
VNNPGPSAHGLPVEPLAFSVDDSCRATGVGRTTLYAAIKNGELRATKVGRRTVILRADLESWLNSCRGVA